MKTFIAALALLGLTAFSHAQEPQPKEPRVALDTSHGRIVIELNARRAPLSVDNFLAYANSGYYDDTLFHRVIPDFMIQGGGFEPGMKQKPTLEPIRNEADNGLKNLAGTIAMARTQNPHSATSQFYINLVDNPALDQPSGSGWGYAVFGHVVEGMDVVQEIAQEPTGRVGMRYRDVPREDVVIKSVRPVGAADSR